MKTIERSFKDLIALCLKRWKTLIIGAVIGAIVFAGIQYKVQLGIKNDPEMSEEAIEARYQAAMAEYNSQISQLDRDDENDRKTVERVQQYLDDSLLMQINPNNKYVGIMDIVIEFTDEEAYTQNFGYSTTPLDYMTIRTRKQYLSAYNMIDLGSMPGLVQLHPDTVQKFWDEVLWVYEKEGGMIEIYAQGSNEAEVQSMLQTIFDFLQSKTDIICQTAFEHSLTVLSDIQKIEIDKELEAKQNDQYNAIREAENRVNDRVDQRAAMEVPQREDGYSMETMVAAVRSFALIGVIIGIVLAMFIIMLHCVGVKQVITSREIEAVNGIQYFGALSKKYRKHNLISDMISGERTWKDQDSAVAFINATLGNIGEGKRIVLASTLNLNDEDSRITCIKTKLESDKLDVTIITDALHNAEFMKILNPNTSVVLMEQAVYSRMEAIEDIKKICEKAAVDSVGFVMMQE